MMSVAVQGKPYRYGYAVSARPPTSYGNALSKFDMEAGTSKQWHEAGCIPVEPVMVPRPGAQASPLLQSLPFLHGQQAGITGSGRTVCFLQHPESLRHASIAGATAGLAVASALTLVLPGCATCRCQQWCHGAD